MEDRLQPKTAPQCTREPYTAGVLEAPAGYSGQAARTGRTAFMSGPVFGDRSRPGRLIRKSSTGAIHFVTNEGGFGLATQRHVTNPTTLSCIFHVKPWLESTDFEVDNQPPGPAIHVPACGTHSP